MCVRACVQILLMGFLVSYDLIVLIAFHQVEAKVLMDNKMGDSIDKV